MQLHLRLKLITVNIYVFSCFIAYAQLPLNAFSFSCIKDTTVCSQENCITLRATIPNIRSSTDSYVVNRISGPEGCFRQYVSPDAPGNSTGLFIDDVYTNGINLPFNFPFYDIVYNSLVVSGNGYISFDLSNATQFSHYSMLSSGTGLTATGTGPGVNLPDSRYDRALVMGAYQDFNAFYNTSPDMKVKYETIGTAPCRKWILSYYLVPLYSCQNLIQNTQQIVLYESTGIIEVFINSKQICTGWNKGKAMIGMQDYERSRAVIAPGRAASDAAWGSTDMNESWRFTPAGGTSLFKKTELYTTSGELVATGDTANTGNGNYRIIFNNICSDESKTYVIKSTYKNIEDTLDEIYAADTIHVTKTSSMQSVWTGSINNTWENPLNWQCNSLPGINSDVFIYQGNIQVSSDITVKSITVSPGAAVNVNPGYNLSVIQPH